MTIFNDFDVNIVCFAEREKMKTLLGFSLLCLFCLSGCSVERDSKTYSPTKSSSEHHAYIVGIHPYLNSQKTFLAYRPLLDYLEKNIPNSTFVLETSKDYPHYEQKLYAKAFDFSLPNPYQTVNSLQHGYKVIAKMKPDSAFRGILVARKDSHIRNVQDLKGKKISFPAATALAATMMPLYFLKSKGLDIDKDIEKRYVGSQFSSIMNAYSGDTFIAGTWPTSCEDWCKAYPEKEREMEIVWETEPLVNNGFVALSSLPEPPIDAVAHLLTTLQEHQEGVEIIRNSGFAGFEPANNHTYDKVDSFLKMYDTSIGLPQ